MIHVILLFALSLILCNVYLTILSAVIQGVLEPEHIDGPYTLDVGRKWTLSKQILVYCSPNERLPLSDQMLPTARL